MSRILHCKTFLGFVSDEQLDGLDELGGEVNEWLRIHKDSGTEVKQITDTMVMNDVGGKPSLRILRRIDYLF